ncbi:UspA domain protein [Candidatus Vecturithrix granuli]|uniref:UspA domain protein n=1 Tax=Vecturithrix granuli TaxID=1499967 RepID=A0A081C8D5_VECG1|nr:UspA domain protein [Candidatus Vecturithrix granuli]
MQKYQYQSAIQDFRRARRRASLEQLLSYITGKSDDLLSYEEVRKQLKASGMSGKKLKEIPLDAIIGSVGRYRDFTRSFLPRSDSDQQRWASIQAIAKGMQGFPPIEVYQIGEVYFVLDGNHRVSVARQLGAKYIEAYVTEIQTRVPLTPDIQPNELSRKAEYAEFLVHTHLDELRPGCDLSMNIPGRYRLLEEQIEEHRYFMGIEQQREIPYNEAVMNWYDAIYLPMIQIIRKHEIVKKFPEYTLTDLYLWISEYRASMRQEGSNHLENALADIQTKFRMLPGFALDTTILDIEHVDFLEQTRIAELRPDADIRVTAPGKYQELSQHIKIHQYFMGVEQQRDIPYHEAVVHWYETVYLPIVAFIRKQEILQDFPNRTEADLYLWIAEYHAELEKRLGWRIQPEIAATDLAAHFSQIPERIFSRVSEKLLDALTPEEFEAGPPPGEWRKEILATRRNDRLFNSMLVPINGKEEGWRAVDQAIPLARHENGYLCGLHVVTSKELYDREAAHALQIEFARRCEAAGVQGALAIEFGEIALKICERARWTDLVILSLAHPPGLQPLDRLKSGFRTILHRCSRPVLAVPRVSAAIHRALLAYDGSRKADEALFVSAYIGNYLQIPIVVVTVKEHARRSSEILSLARGYLKRRNVEATFIEETGHIGEAILSAAAAYQCNLIIAGSYGYSPVLEVVLGSAIDEVLRRSQIPIFLCR